FFFFFQAVDDIRDRNVSGFQTCALPICPYGDLYVIFRVKPSDTFTRRGTEIYSEFPINIVQATLGDELEVPTVHGKVKLKIPAEIGRASCREREYIRVIMVRV